MNFLTITKNANGSYTIKDTITDKTFTYYFCSEHDAIKQHRKSTNTQKKHLQKYIYKQIRPELFRVYFLYSDGYILAVIFIYQFKAVLRLF